MLEKNPTTTHCDIPCSLWRRLGAVFYDAIVLICIIFIAWQPVPLLPESLHPVLGRLLRLGYLLTICFLFFGWFWTHGGQTLGMRAWRIKLVAGGPGIHETVKWRLAWQRFTCALLSWGVFGIGFIWSLFHHDNLAWHDIYSKTRLVVIPRN